MAPITASTTEEPQLPDHQGQNNVDDTQPPDGAIQPRCNS